MLTLEAAFKKIKQLSPAQQQQVFQFIEFLEFKANDPDETSTEEAIAGINQGLKEALNDRTIPISQMWEGIDAE